MVGLFFRQPRPFWLRFEPQIDLRGYPATPAVDNSLIECFFDEPEILEELFEEFDCLPTVVDDPPAPDTSLKECFLDEPENEEFYEEFDIVLLTDHPPVIESLLDDPENEEEYQSEDIIFPSRIEDDPIFVFYEDIEFDETSEEDPFEPLPIDAIFVPPTFEELIISFVEEEYNEESGEENLYEPLGIDDYTIIINSTGEELFLPAPDEDYNEEDPDESYFDFIDIDTISPPAQVITGGRQVSEKELIRAWMSHIGHLGRLSRYG